ncbi:hypothetical protein Z043_112741 [Scleropages formosus]|uniref:PH domain-containing protein n=1 Tax=Scleropages formosus TaxID=113540 RepID=A0A0P7UFS0_SCLFO|nr:hypothetical protein Z043_112741 [Scleropages formosus]
MAAVNGTKVTPTVSGCIDQGEEHSKLCVAAWSSVVPLEYGRAEKAGPRYKYFLRDLTENTSADSSDFPQLSVRPAGANEKTVRVPGAVKAVSEVAQRIQDNARSHENHLQLRRVQRLLKGRKTKVLAPGRWYIREGWLQVVPPKGTETKPKMFFLFSDILLQTTPCSPLHPTNGDKFACQRIYPLKECVVDKVFGHTKSQGGLISVSERHAYLTQSSLSSPWHKLWRGLARKCTAQVAAAQCEEQAAACCSPCSPPGGGGASASKRMKLTEIPAERCSLYGMGLMPWVTDLSVGSTEATAHSSHIDTVVAKG